MQLFFLKNSWLAPTLCVLVFVIYLFVFIRSIFINKRNSKSAVFDVICGVISVFVFPVLIYYTISIPDSSTTAEMDRIYHEANTAFDEEDYESSREKLETLIGMDPDNPRWHSRMADVKYKQKEYNESLDEIKIALDYSPDNGDYLRRKGQCLYHLDRLQEARDVLEDAAFYQNKQYLNFEYLGYVCEFLEDYEAEEAAYKAAIDLKPENNARLHYWLCRAYTWQGRYNEALYELDLAMDMDPDNKTGEKMERVIKQSMEASENPDDSEKVNLLGHALISLGEYKKAAEQYDRAISLNPQSAMLYHNRGYAYSLLDEYDLAKQDMYTAMTMDSSDEYFASEYNYTVKKESAINNPDDVNAQTDYCYAMFQCNDYSGAANQLNKVKLLLLKNGKSSENIESAIDAFSIITSSENNNDNDIAFVHYWIGRILFDKEDYESALDESDNAISLMEDALFYDLKGCSLLRLNRDKEAILAFEKANNMDPNNNNYIEKLEYAKVRFQLNNLTEEQSSK